MLVIRQPSTIQVHYQGVVPSGNRSFEILRVVGVELTRRNLLALLAKLDGHPQDSACTISKDGVYIKAVHDFEHYGGGVDPGSMHPETEHKLHQLYAGGSA